MGKILSKVFGNKEMRILMLGKSPHYWDIVTQVDGQTFRTNFKLLKLQLWNLLKYIFWKILDCNNHSLAIRICLKFIKILVYIILASRWVGYLGKGLSQALEIKYIYM